MKIKKRDFSNPWRTMKIWYIPTCTYLILKLGLGDIAPDKEWYWWIGISIAVLIWLAFNLKIVKNDDWGGLSDEELIGDDEIPGQHKKKCEHPIRRREGYREGVYKCWECGKIIFED